MDLLSERGAVVGYNDPYKFCQRREDFNKETIELTHQNLSQYDCVAIVTEHPFTIPIL